MTLPSELPPGDEPPLSEPFRCLIPAEAVGLIVGRNNSTVQQICSESGADIHVSGVRDTPPPLSDRIVTISGEVLQRKSAISFIVHRLFQAQEVADNMGGIFVVVVPTAATHLIGSLQPTAAEIHVENEAIGSTELHPVRILGTLDHTIKAAALINDLLDSVRPADSGRAAPRDFEPAPPAQRQRWRSVSADGSGEELDAAVDMEERTESGHACEDAESDAHFANNKTVGAADEFPLQEDQDPPQHLGTINALGVAREDGGRASKAARGHRTAVACRCLAPTGAIGLIIGKRGARLRQILKETGAVVTVSSDEDTPASLSDRIVFISGNATQRDAACIQIIEKLFQAQAVMRGGQGMFIMLVPSCFVDSIMGSADGALAALCADSGACIELEEECISETQDQPVRIVGTLEQCGAAASSVAALVQELLDGSGHALSSGDGSLGATPLLRTRADSRVGGGLGKDGGWSEQLPSAAGITRLALAPSTAMLIDGRKCQLLLERQQHGRAVVEVSDTGERYHVVTIRGDLEARMHVVKLLFGYVDHVSPGAFREAALLVPSSVVGLLVGNGGRAIHEICKKSGAGAALTKAVTPHEQLLSITGNVEALIKATQLAATLVAEAAETREKGTSATARSHRDRVGVRPSKSKPAARDDAQGRSSDPRGMTVENMPSAASEDALQTAASPDLPDSSDSQIMLLLPKEMAQKLVSSNGQVRTIAERSGSRVELTSVRKVDISSSQLLTLSGTRLGNSMAALYLQELLV